MGCSLRRRKNMGQAIFFWKALREAEIVIGGCAVGPEKWECRECRHRWPDDLER